MLRKRMRNGRRTLRNDIKSSVQIHGVDLLLSFSYGLVVSQPGEEQGRGQTVGCSKHPGGKY